MKSDENIDIEALREIATSIWVGAGLRGMGDSYNSILTPELKESDGRIFWSPVATMIQVEHLVALMEALGILPDSINVDNPLPVSVSPRTEKKTAARRRVPLKPRATSASKKRERSGGKRRQRVR